MKYDTTVLHNVKETIVWNSGSQPFASAAHFATFRKFTTHLDQSRDLDLSGIMNQGIQSSCKRINQGHGS